MEQEIINEIKEELEWAQVNLSSENWEGVEIHLNNIKKIVNQIQCTPKN